MKTFTYIQFMGAYWRMQHGTYDKLQQFIADKGYVPDLENYPGIKRLKRRPNVLPTRIHRLGRA